MAIEIKKTKRIMQFCQDMYERRMRGHNYPSCWMVKTREALELAGVVTEVDDFGKQYYFTTEGLAWYLKNN